MKPPPSKPSGTPPDTQPPPSPRHNNKPPPPSPGWPISPACAPNTAPCARLERANRAATLDAAYPHLNTLRQQQHDDEHSLATLSAALPGQQSALAAADTALASAQAALAAARQQHDANQPHWQTMRAYDQRLADQQHTLHEHE